MVYLRYEAHPKPSSPRYGAIDGAFIGCWVNATVIDAADAAARQFLADLGWEIDEREEARFVVAADYAASDPGRAYLEQALLDTVVAEVHTWPVGAADE